MIFAFKLYLALGTLAALGVVWTVRSERSLTSSASSDKKTERATERTRHRRGKAGSKILLTHAERIEFLAEHNRIRNNSFDSPSRRQPPAAAMMRMYWNAQLEASAIAWSRRSCSGVKHGQSEVVNLPEFVSATSEYDISIGQIIYATTGVKPSATDILTLSVNESVDFTYSSTNSGRCKAGHTCADYTQIVWGKSFLVGCGYAFCGDHYTATCNYLPGGNVPGKSVYKTGPACSRCASNKFFFTECDGGLCVPKDRCSPVKECTVVDINNCLCNETDYDEIVRRLLKNTGTIHVGPQVVVFGLLLPLAAFLLGQKPNSGFAPGLH